MSESTIIGAVVTGDNVSLQSDSRLLYEGDEIYKETDARIMDEILNSGRLGDGEDDIFKPITESSTHDDVSDDASDETDDDVQEADESETTSDDEDDDDA